MSKLIIPVYLNQKFVFDLLAMMQGGISTVTTVNESSKKTESEGEKLSAGFGLSNAFSTLLKIDLSGSSTKSTGAENNSSSSQVRVHTPASLLFQLRNLLIQNSYLILETNENLPKAGDFIEFEGYLKRNPFVESIDTLSEIAGIAQSFETKTNQKSKSKPNQKPNSQQIIQQLAKLSDALKAGSTIDLTCNSNKLSYTAVITLETEFLNDPQMSDLVDGHFKIIGKVIRSVDKPDESINLLRKTALSRTPPEIIRALTSGLHSLSQEKGFIIPDLNHEISGPAIQVLPIAIYA